MLMMPFWFFLYGNKCMHCKFSLKVIIFNLLLSLTRLFLLLKNTIAVMMTSLMLLHSIHTQLVSIHYLSQELYSVGYVPSFRVRRKCIDKTQGHVFLSHLYVPLHELKMEIEKPALLTRPASGLMTAWVIFCLSVRKYIYMYMLGHMRQAAKLHCKWHRIWKDNKTEVFTFQDRYN